MAKTFLVDLNLNQNELQNSVIQNLASDPASGIAGQIYYNTAINKLKVYNGTTWVNLEKGTGTVTSIGVSNATNGGLTVSGSPVTTSGTISVGHSNVLTNAQSTLGVYPIKIDKNGHISEYDVALDVVDMDNTEYAGFLPSYTERVNTDDKVGNSDYVYDVTEGEYRQLPATAFSDTTYTDGTAGYILKAKQDKDGKQIDTTYAKLASPTLTGTPKAPTASAGTNTTQIATTAFVTNAISGISGAMYFKGTIGTGGTAGTTLPTTGVTVGDTYKIVTAGTYASQAAKVGDMFIATATTPTWAYVPSGDDTDVTQITAGAGLNTTSDDTTTDGGSITTTGTLYLTKTAVTPGTYQGITVDKYGRVTAASNQGYSTLKKYSTNITGNASKTSFTLTHNLGSRDVVIQVYDNSTYDEVMVDIVRTTTNTATISFAQAPASGKVYRVVCIG